MNMQITNDIIRLAANMIEFMALSCRNSVDRKLPTELPTVAANADDKRSFFFFGGGAKRHIVMASVSCRSFVVVVVVHHKVSGSNISGISGTV